MEVLGVLRDSGAIAGLRTTAMALSPSKMALSESTRPKPALALLMNQTFAGAI